MQSRVVSIATVPEPPAAGTVDSELVAATWHFEVVGAVISVDDDRHPAITRQAMTTTVTAKVRGSCFMCAGRRCTSAFEGPPNVAVSAPGFSMEPMPPGRLAEHRRLAFVHASAARLTVPGHVTGLTRRSKPGSSCSVPREDASVHRTTGRDCPQLRRVQTNERPTHRGGEPHFHEWDAIGGVAATLETLIVISVRAVAPPAPATAPSSHPSRRGAPILVPYCSNDSP